MRKALLALAAIGATTALGLSIPARSPATPAPMPSESGMPEAFKRAVTKSMTTSSSGTIDLNVAKKADKPGTLKAKISYAYAPQPAPTGTFKVMDLTVNGKAREGAPRVLWDGDTVYINPGGMFPQVREKEWWKISLTDVPGAGAFLKRLSDPDMPSKMLGAYKNVHVVGQETVDGVPLTRYAGTFDVAAMNQALGLSGKDKYANQMPQTLTFDAWVDGQDYVRRSDVEGASTQGMIAWSVRVREYGRPVTIPTPSPDEVAELDVKSWMKKASPSPS